MSKQAMSQNEIEQFLTCARVGRLGLIVSNAPYVVPVGYAYFNGQIFFHTCNTGLKMGALRRSPSVCFEVDETLSDCSMYKTVIVLGTAKIIEDRKEIVPYLQKLIDKYRVPETFDKYMSKPGRNRDKELEAVRICVIAPTKITGKKWVQTQPSAEGAEHPEKK